MASPFAKYQSEQVQQIAPGFIEAYGRAGASIGQGIAAVGQGIAIADENRKKEIATKASLAPYIRNDDRITATEGMIKSGLLTKADDGTVVVAAKWVNYADTAGLKKYLDFYNETGGDGSKLSGDKLIEFASRFEGEQKYIAQQAANKKSKTEDELKAAQIAKLKAEAAAKGMETGLVTQILAGFGSDSSPATDLSPTAGINITPYTGTTGTSVTPPADTSAPVTKVDPTVSNVADPAAPVSAALTAGTAPTVAAAAVKAAEPAVSAALTAGTAGTPAPAAAQTREERLASLIAKAEASEKVAPAPKRVESGETSEDYDAWVAATDEWNKKYGDTHIPTGSPKTARRVELDFNAANPVEKAAPAAAEATEVKTWADAAAIVGESEPLSRYRGERLAGMTPSEYVADWKAAQAAKSDAAPAPAAAEAPAPAPLESRATPAGTPIPETFDVAAESVAVGERLAKVNTERTTVREKYTKDRTRVQADIAKKRQQVLALTVLNPQKGAALGSYNENILKFINEAEARDLKAVDDKEAAINRDFANYQAAAAAQRGKTTDAARVRAELRAERKETADIEKAKAEAATASEKARQVLSDRKKAILQEYPAYAVWAHQGARMGNDPKTGQPYDPSDFEIRALTAATQNSVNEAVEGWNKSTSFLIDLDSTLKSRVKDNNEWRNRFRGTADNMKNYFEGELASVFGVATLRRAIVSGGNFSDADREFVKSAITYINSAAPDLSAEDLKASLDALAVFVNGLYERTLETNDMGYDPDSSKRQADKLEAAGFGAKADKIRKGVDRGNLFYSRFGIKPPGGNSPSVSQESLQSAFNVLYPKLQAKGLLPKGMKAN